jgi:hypothetical protein
MDHRGSSSLIPLEFESVRFIHENKKSKMLQVRTQRKTAGGNPDSVTVVATLKKRFIDPTIYSFAL